MPQHQLAGNSGRFLVSGGGGSLYLSFQPLGRFLAFGFVLGELVLFPMFAAFGEEAFQEFRSGFRVRVFGSPFGGEPAFHGGFENRGPVAFEVRLGPLQSRHPRIQIGKQFLNLRHNAALFVWWGRNCDLSKIPFG